MGRIICLSGLVPSFPIKCYWSEEKDSSFKTPVLFVGKGGSHLLVGQDTFFGRLICLSGLPPSFHLKRYWSAERASSFKTPVIFVGKGGEGGGGWGGGDVLVHQTKTEVHMTWRRATCYWAEAGGRMWT